MITFPAVVLLLCGKAVAALASDSDAGPLTVTVEDGVLDNPIEADQFDVCANSTRVSDLPFIVSGNTEGNVIQHFLNFDCDITGVVQGHWYEYTATESKIMRATAAFAPDFNGMLSVYRGSCGGTFACVDKTSPYSFPQAVSWPAQGGMTYFVLVSGDWFEDDGDYNLSLESFIRPSNDVCQSPSPVSTLPFIISANSTGAYPAFTDEACGTGEDHVGLWYQYTALDSQSLRATVTDQTFEVALSVYSGTCGGSFTCVDNTASSAYSDRVVSWVPTANSVYYVFVAGDGYGAYGDFTLTLEASTTPPNDDCEDATEIDVLPYSSIGDTKGAISVFSDSWCVMEPETGLWFKYSPTENHLARATASVQSFAARLAVFQGTCGGGLSCIDYTYPESYWDHTLTWAAYSNRTYYMFVSGNEGGQFSFSLGAYTRPENDVCEEPVVVPSLPFETSGNNEGAFPYNDAACGISYAPGVWYEYTALTNQVVSATSQTEGFSSQIAVSSGECSLGLDCKASSCCSSDLNVRWLASAGTTYHITVAGSDLRSTGDFSLSLSAFDVPPNDKCGNATAIAALPFNVTGNNEFSYPNFYYSSCGVTSDDRGLWYKYTATQNQNMWATVSGHNFYASLSIYSGSCFSISCIGYTYGYYNNVYTWSAYAGTTYYILVTGRYGYHYGDFDLSVEATPLPESPDNDICENATVVDSIPFTTEGNTEYAIVDSFLAYSCNLYDYSRGLWYEYTAVEGKGVRAMLFNQNFYATMQVFSGSCLQGNLVCIDYASASWSVSNVAWFPEVGTTSYIRVSGPYPYYYGSFSLTLDTFDVPPNGKCQNATVVEALPFNTTASNEYGFPNFYSSPCGVTSDDRGLWYEYTPVQNEVVVATLSDQFFYATMSLYSGTCGFISCLDYTGASYGDRVLTWTANAGTRYYILVTGRYSNEYGFFSLSINAMERPENDSCDNATSVLTLPFNASGTTAYTSQETFYNPSCGISHPVRGLWYKYSTTTASQRLVLLATFSANFDGMISVYNGTCTNAVCIQHAYSYYSTRTLGWSADGGQTYYIFVSNACCGSYYGDFDLSLQSVEAPPNDQCATALDIVSLPFNVTGNNEFSFPNFESSCGVTSDDRGLWYKVTPTNDEVIRAWVTGQTFYASMSVYTGSCDVGLSCVDYSSSYSEFSLTWSASAGTTYYVLVTGRYDYSYGNFALSLMALERLENDACETAQSIQSLPFYASGDTSFAFSGGFFNYECNIYSDVRGLWYTYTATQDVGIRTSVYAPSFDRLVSVYEDGLPGNCTGSCVGSSQYESYGTEVLHWGADAGKKYNIFVSGRWPGAYGYFSLSLETYNRPPNDECDNAMIVSELPFSTTGNNEFGHSDFYDWSCSVDSNDRKLWYQYTAAQDQYVRATVYNQNFRAVLSVHSGTCNGNITCIDNTYYSSYSDLVLTWPAEAGTTYFILVSGWYSYDYGDYYLSVTAIDSPSNDDCANALVAAMPSYFSANTELAFPSDPNYECGVLPGVRGLWYKHTATQDRNLRARLQYQSFYAMIAVFDGVCNAHLNCLVNTYGSYSNDRIATWPADAGTTYYILGAGMDANDYGYFDISFEALDRPPNDICEGAARIPSLPFAAVGNNEGAYPSFSNSACGVTGDERGVWYEYAATVSQNVRAAVSNQGFYTKLSLFGGGCGTSTSLSCFATSGSERYWDVDVAFPAYAGSSYYLFVSGDWYGASGDFTLMATGIERTENDACGSATEIPSIPFTLTGNNTGALPDFESSQCGLSGTSRALWYKYSAVADAIHFVTFSSSFMASVAVFEGSCGSLVCLGSSYPAHTQGSRSWVASAQQIYYVVVFGDEFADYGDIQLTINANERVENDVCSGAVDIVSSISGSNSPAVPSFGNLLCNVGMGTRGVWYKYTAPTDAVVTATMFNYDFNAVVSVYSGDCGTTACMGTQESCINVFEGDRIVRCPSFSMQFMATAESTYYMMVSGREFSDSGPFELALTTRSPDDEPGFPFCLGASSCSSMLGRNGVRLYRQQNSRCRDRCVAAAFLMRLFMNSGWHCNACGMDEDE